MPKRAHRRRMIELVHSGRKPEELSREFEPSAQANRNWVRLADWDQGIRLRRENTQLREEREILKEAAEWAAKGTGTIPSGS